MVSLLRDGYGLDAKATQLTFALDVDGTDVEWALGAFLYLRTGADLVMQPLPHEHPAVQSWLLSLLLLCVCVHVTAAALARWHRMGRPSPWQLGRACGRQRATRARRGTWCSACCWRRTRGCSSTTKLTPN